MNSIKDVTVVGLTGQSGSGKTTISNYFSNNGFAVINADIIARELTQKDTQCLSEISVAFPDCIDKDTGELNRAQMAKVVFTDKEMLKKYTSIIYPYITTKIIDEIRNKALLGNKYVLLDAPTLFESHADDFCNYIISVIADEEIRIKRIMARDNLSLEKAKERLNAQFDDNYYIKRSDMVIKNNGNLEDFILEAQKVVIHIKEMFYA